MAFFESASPAKRARTENVAGPDMGSCAGCGVLGHSVDMCPFAAIIGKTSAVTGTPALYGQSQGNSVNRQGKGDGGQKTWRRTALCKYYQAAGSCKYGNECGYAHGEAELNTPITQKRETSSGVASIVGSAPSMLDGATIANMVKIAEESADWLSNAAAYCTANANAADLESAVETAGQAVQRVAWVHSAVMVHEAQKDTADAAEAAIIRNAVIEAKEKAEAAYLTCEQILKFKKAQTSSFELLLSQAPSNQAGIVGSQRHQDSKRFPDVSTLSIMCTAGWTRNTSQLRIEGFNPEAVAVVYTKNCELFTDSHHILQAFCGKDHWVTDLITVKTDTECTEFPEVWEAWKAQGGYYWPMTIAKCNQLKKWAVGFSGKKDGDKTAKLAIALSIAGAIDSLRLAQVVEVYPDFGKLLSAGNF